MNVQQVGPLPGVTTDAYAIHTLVLDDSSFDRKRILRLGDRINLPLVFEEASSLAGLKHCLDRRNYDLFLIDYSMPDSDGLAALDVIREHHNHHSAASIMVSGAADLRVVIHAMKRGCRDFIAKKDMSPDTLYHAMMGALDRTAEPPCPAPEADPMTELDQLRIVQQPTLDDTTLHEILCAPREASLMMAAHLVGLGLRNSV